MGCKSYNIGVPQCYTLSAISVSQGTYCRGLDSVVNQEVLRILEVFTLRGTGRSDEVGEVGEVGEAREVREA